MLRNDANTKLQRSVSERFFKYFVYYPVVWVRRQPVPTYVSQLRLSQYWDEERLRVHQLARLRELVNHAATTVPFYAEKWSDGQRRIDSLQELNSLGFLTKADLKRNWTALRSARPGRGLFEKTTGGSTGEPVTILKNADALARELAATWRGYSWAGIDIGDKQARFWGMSSTLKGRLNAQLTDFVTHRKRCSAFAFQESDLRVYTRTLEKFDPTYCYGYVSMLVAYAEHFRRLKQEPPFSLRCIITTSEVLAESDRRVLERTFRTRVFNEYGCGEIGSIAHECPAGKLHVMAENIVLEVLDGERPCRLGELGEIVVTELNNTAMPLIRYRTGDLGALAESTCQCGISLPTIQKIAGRAYDMIVDRGGKRYHGEFFMYIFEEAKRRNLGVGGFQVIQEDVDKLRIRIRPEAGYGEVTRRFIEDRLHRDFDSRVRVIFEETSEINRERSGKFRLIKGMADQPAPPIRVP